MKSWKRRKSIFLMVAFFVFLWIFFIQEAQDQTYRVGSFTKSTGAAPASQSVTGVGFRPSAVPLANFQDVTQANPVAQERFGLGASDGTSEGCSASQNEDYLGISNVKGIDKTSKVFVKVNNTTPGPSLSFTTEQVGGSNAHALILTNPATTTPNYKWQFLTGGVRLFYDRKDGFGWVQLISQIQTAPEYMKQQGAPGNFIWNPYGLNINTSGADVLQGFDKQNQAAGSVKLIRTYSTTEEGIAETLTETWTIPASAQELGAKGPKAFYSMTKNRGIVLTKGVQEGTWRMRWALSGISDIVADNSNMVDETGYPIRQKWYNNNAFAIDVNDFDNGTAIASPYFSYSEIGANNKAEILFWKDGTTGNRLVDPTTVATNVATGWSHSKQRNVFYNGSNFFLLYTKGGGTIFYNADADNAGTWDKGETSLITNQSTTVTDFDIYLVDDSKFDIVYETSGATPVIAVKTCTISSQTISCNDGDTFGDTANSLAIGRTPSNGRIWVAVRDGAELEVWYPNSTGDASSAMAWTDMLDFMDANLVNYVTMVPYGSSDTVLVIYQRDPGGTSADGIYSRTVNITTLGSRIAVSTQGSGMAAATVFGNAIRVSDTEFHYVYYDYVNSVLKDTTWNNSAWGGAVNIYSGTSPRTPSLFYDSLTGDFYAFYFYDDIASSQYIVYRHTKPAGGSWSSRTQVDDNENTVALDTYPITQMHEPPAGSARVTPRQLVWAYRVYISASNYNLKVGNLTLSECSENFEYRKSITVQSGKVSGGPHTDFPMLVSVTDANLAHTTHGGHVTKESGWDIIFRALDDTTCNVAEGGTNPCTLAHEIEEYNHETGNLVAWVKVPKLYYNSDSDRTVIYMYYGNSCITSSTEDASGVWDANYKGVWHLNNNPAGTQPAIKDSTGINHGTAVNMITSQLISSGKIDGALEFNISDTNDIINVSDHATLKPAKIAVEAWLRPTNLEPWDAPVIKTTGTSWTNGYGIVHNQGVNTKEISFYINSYNSANQFVSTTITVDGLTWTHIVGTYDPSLGSANIKLFVNGAQVGSANFTTAISHSTDPLSFGSDDVSADMYNGLIDEVRISDIARSPGWIQTEYNNMYSPSTFYSVGSETAAPTAVGLVSFRATGQGASVLVEWETAQEISNLGFNLYRMAGANGSFIKLNRDLIPGLVSSVKGRKYSYIDTGVTNGALYYYLLEDVDLSGKGTMHDPVCVDWDNDGIPDDHEKKAIDEEEDKDESGPEEDPGLTEWTPSPYGESASWVKVENFRARQQADGVSLEWVTSFEVDNLGFHVYREQDGKYYRITADLVPGSVFNAGAGRELLVGQRYIYFDAISELTGQESYWLDCVGLDGARASFGPIKPEIGGRLVPERFMARFRSISRHQVSREEKLGKILELRKELKSKETEMQASRAVFSSQTVISQVVPGKPSEPRLPPSEAQWVLAAKSAVKISVKEEGWYRVGQPELVAAGLDSWVDPHYLQLYVDGEEQSMMVTGSNDGRFDPEDSVEFYGRGLDTPFTDTRVYWLVVGSRPGRRLDTPLTDIRMGLDIKMLLGRGLRGRGAPLSFPYSVELKERTFYFAALKNGEDESFFGSVVYTEPVDQLINVPHPDPSAPDNARLEVVLQGATDSSHQVKILFNNQEVGLLVFGGQDRGTVEIKIPHSLILDGENIVTLEAQGGSMDTSLVDYIRLTYWRTYTADEDSLKFTAMGTEWLSIAGFSTEEIRVVDITDPVQMFDVEGRVKPEGSGYAITFKVPGHGQRELFAFSEEKIKEPAGVGANMVSSWHKRTQGADVVVISSRDFLESVRALKELREQQGWSVVVVNVEDLYDEFNFGSKSPWALREFLGRAYDRWVPAPRFVVLVGDSSYDPCNYLGFGDFDFVPTKYVDTEYIKTASDDWFVDFDDDGLPNMAVGRLPVDSAEEAEAVVSKIISYESESVAGFMNEVLLVADANDSPYNFEASSAEVAALLPQGMTVRQILRGQNPAARADLLALLNQGQLVVNYIGHGSTEIWKGNLLTSSDAWDLTNSPYLPFLVSMTCLNGFFQDPSGESMAETFLKAERGGAVGVWASSGLTFPPEQILMNRRLIQLLFNGQGLTIGEAVALSKQAFMDMDVRRTWILFGDPTTKLKWEKRLAYFFIYNCRKS